MSRWIDADALIAELQKDEARFDKEAEDARNDPSYTEGYSDSMWSRANGIRDAMIEIYDAPSIDIVRCRECKWYGNEQKKIYECCTYWAQNGGVIVPMTADDFCSYGEREGE